MAHEGIAAAGGTGTFIFSINANGETLSALSFLSVPGDNEPSQQDAVFVARFRGEESETIAGTVVPLPTAAWGGLALLGMLGAAKLRSTRKQMA